MSTPVNPVYSATPSHRSGAEPPGGGSALADHLDFMFGTQERRYPTGSHVEVLRMPGPGATRYFRKRFSYLETEEGRHDCSYCTSREQFLAIALNHYRLPHVQIVRATEIGKYFETQDAGPELKHWLDLPVARAGLELDHVLFDCANWFSLARWGLQALRGVNAEGFVHLDLKADNICLPSCMPFDPNSGLVLPDWSRLCLIDFAFSVWERNAPLKSEMPLFISKEESNRYQSHQLLNAIQIMKDSGFKDMSAVRKLDWRADLYSLGYLLAGILDHLPSALRAGKAGWTAERLQAAEDIVATLQGFDENWVDYPQRLPPFPHDDLINRLNWLLKAPDLQQSLAEPWNIVTQPGWKPGAAGQHTPVTRVAHNLRGKSEARSRQPQRLWLVGGIAALVALAGGYLAWRPSPPTPAVIAPVSSPADNEAEKQAALKEQALIAKAVDMAEPDAERAIKAKREAFRLAEAEKAKADAARLAEKTKAEAEAEAEAARRVEAARLAEAEKAKAEASRLAEKVKAEAARKTQAEVARQAAEREALLIKRKLESFNKGAAALKDRTVKGNAKAAGAWYSAALQDVSEQTLSNADRQMTNDILRAVDAVALVGGDRAFAAAILPGLTHVAELGDAPSAKLLANLLVCRISPPRPEDAKRYLNIAAQNPVWKETALARLKTLGNTELCETFSKPK